jgi:hypothetical protein
VLKIRESWEPVRNEDRWGDFMEVRPLDPWNMGLTEAAVMNPGTGFRVVQKKVSPEKEDAPDASLTPWNLENAPVTLVTTGKQIPDWTLYRGMAGPLPHSLPLKHLQEVEPEELVLVPYGCSTLRITEFPVVR